MTAFPTTRLYPDLSQPWRDAPAFMAVAGLAVLGLAPLMAAMALDARTFQGASVWLKPVKFHVALAVYLVTLAVYARFLSPAMRTNRVWRLFAFAVGFAVVVEMVWIGGAASLGAASHFNTADPLLVAVYPVMGAFAVLLTSASLVMGIGIWRASGPGSVLRLSLALGLVLTFVLTVGVAGHLSSAGGHVVGTSTRELPLLGWSRDAGDLRVAHFFATHALHALPLVGWLATRAAPVTGRAVVWGASALYTALVLGTLAQATAGRPFLPWLG